MSRSIIHQLDDISETLEWFNDLPIAVPACSGGSMYASTVRCWYGDDESYCGLKPFTDLGLCEDHLKALREIGVS